jgi:hypothetical protein
VTTGCRGDVHEENHISQMSLAGPARDLRQNSNTRDIFRIRALSTGSLMDDSQNGELRFDFDGRLKQRFVGSYVTTDAGLLA